MSWYKKIISPYPHNGQEINSIQDEFNEFWSKAGLSEDMALFHVLTPDEEAIYFSPATENYAISCGAAPCDKPLNGSFDYRISVLCANGSPFERFEIMPYTH